MSRGSACLGCLLLPSLDTEEKIGTATCKLTSSGGHLCNIEVQASLAFKLSVSIVSDTFSDLQ